MTDVTRILAQLESGDASAAEQLLPLVYNELRRLAAASLADEKSSQTLQPTALVHEAYLRLVDTDRAQHWNSRGHFFGAAAEAMRRILVVRARARQSLKRGGNRLRVKVADLEDRSSTSQVETTQTLPISGDGEFNGGLASRKCASMKAKAGQRTRAKPSCRSPHFRKGTGRWSRAQSTLREWKNLTILRVQRRIRTTAMGQRGDVDDWKPKFQFSDKFRVRWIGGKVLPFVRIRTMIIQFFAAIAIADVSVVFCSQCVVVGAECRQRGMFPLGTRMIQQRTQ